MPRVRFTILMLMALVAISAIVINWLRPVTRTEAEKLAEARFLKVPGASRWVGRYTVNAWPCGSKKDGDGWLVDLKEKGDGSLISQMFVTPKGRIRGLGLAVDKFR
jgi:hypothetical protein